LIRKVVEAAHIGDGPWRWPSDDFFNVSEVWRASIASENVHKEACFDVEELAFVDVENKVGVCQNRKDDFEVVDVFLQSLAVDEDVIHIDDNELVDILG